MVYLTKMIHTNYYNILTGVQSLSQSTALTYLMKLYNKSDTMQ
jgi:hypothetical protein